MKVFEAALEEETMIITSKIPAMARFRRYFTAAAIALLLAGGATALYVWTQSDGTLMRPRAVVPALPSSGAPLVTRPLETAPPSVLRETETSTATTTHPVLPSTISSVVSTAQSSSVLVEQSKERSAPAKKKTGPAKKKKKRTPSEK